jgi:hypothetical protein
VPARHITAIRKGGKSDYTREQRNVRGGEGCEFQSAPVETAVTETADDGWLRSSGGELHKHEEPRVSRVATVPVHHPSGLTFREIASPLDRNLLTFGILFKRGCPRRWKLFIARSWHHFISSNSLVDPMSVYLFSFSFVFLSFAANFDGGIGSLCSLSHRPSKSSYLFASTTANVCTRKGRPLQNPTFTFWPFSLPIASASSSRVAQNLGGGS